jgi:DNA helicase INO80
VDPTSLQELDFDNGMTSSKYAIRFSNHPHSTEDVTNLHSHARHNAEAAVAAAKRQAQLFDAQAALERKTQEALALAKGQASAPQSDDEETALDSRPLVDRSSFIFFV